MSISLKLKRNNTVAENKTTATEALTTELGKAQAGEPRIATYADDGDGVGILFGISAGDGSYAIFDNHFKTIDGETIVGDGNIDIRSVIDAIDAKVGSNDYSGAQYISKEENTTDALMQLDTEVKATNDNIAIGQEAIRQFSGNVTTLSGEVASISGKVSSNYTDLNGKITTVSGRVNTISGEVASLSGSLGTYATKTELKNYLPLSGGTLTGRLNANQGVAMSGKTASDLLNGAGSTTAVSTIVSSAATTVRGNAPAGLDTLGEIATSIGNSTNFSGAMDTKLAAKVDKAKQLATVVTGINTAAAYSASSVSIRHTRKQLDGGTHEYGNDATLSTVISAATTTAAGVMSATDKSKLNALPSASNVVTLDGTQTISGTKTFSQRVTATGFKTPSGTADGILTADGGVKSITGLSSEITAMIVSGAPEALDTLNELAAALGDDPNFASTVMNKIGAKADIGHKHEIADVNGLQNALNGKANASHTHAISGVSGLQTALDAKVDADDLAKVATSGSYNDLLNKPTIPVVDSALSSGSTNAIQNKAVYNALQGKSNTGHKHNASEISGLAKVATSGSYNDLSNKPSIPVVDATLSSGSTNAIQTKAVYEALADKSDVGHTHSINNINGLQSALDGKANSSHTHTVANISNLGSNWATALTGAKPNWLTSVPSEYVTDSELNSKGFITKTTADSTYQPKGSYLTSVSISTISDLNSDWDALLKADPSSYVTRWPSISEVGSKQNLVVKLNGGTTEGTNQFTYNATAAKTVNVTPSSIGAAASNHSHSSATTSAAGFMSAADKSKLDGIATGANKTTVDSSLSTTSTNPVQNKVINSSFSRIQPRYSFSTNDDAPYNYIHLFRIANKVNYSGIRTEVVLKGRYHAATIYIDITTSDVAYGSGKSSIKITKDVPNGRTCDLYYKETVQASNYNYYDIYYKSGAWNSGCYEVVSTNNLSNLLFESKSTALDALPSGYVTISSTPVGGNSSSATKLQTARKINGTNFDGSADITTANWGTARTLTIGNSGKSVNGSGNVSWSLSEIGAAPSSHTHSISNITNLQSTLNGKANSSHTHTVANISNLGSNWASALTAAKPNWLTSVPSEYVTDSELNAKGFITKTTADSTYQAKGNYLTSVSIATISDLHTNWDRFLKADPDLISNATVLTNQNLNSYSGTSNCGYYYGAGSNSVTNKPSGVDAFSMVVLRSGGAVVSQIVIEGAKRDMYLRYFSSGSWTSWSKFATTDDLTWNNISGKPSSFTPSTHTHTISQVTNLQSQLNSKASSSHTHTIANVTNLQSTLDGKAASNHTHTPSSIGAAAASHTHTLSNVTDLNDTWESTLKNAPSAYVTRWPTISEVSGKTNMVVKLNGGTTEGTNQFTYNGTAAKTVNVTPSSIGAAAASHTHTASQVSGLAKVATSGSYNDLSNKPSIPSAYTLPTASSGTKGGVKIGSGLSMSGEVLNVNFSGYATQSWANGQFLKLTGGTLTGDLNLGDNTLIIENSQYNDKLTLSRSKIEIIDNGDILVSLDAPNREFTLYGDKILVEGDVEALTKTEILSVLNA